MLEWHSLTVYGEDSAASATDATYVYTYSCDDSGASLTGIWKTGEADGYEWDITISYDDPLLQLPPELQAGDRFTDDWSGEVNGWNNGGGSDGYSSDMSGTYELEAAESEPLTLPAGTFEGLELTGTTAQSGYYDTVETWVAHARRGLIWTANYQLIEVQ